MTVSKMSPRLRILLFFSVALNLLVIAAVAGFLVAGDKRGSKRHGPMMQEILGGPVLAPLERSERRALGEEIRSRIGRSNGTRQQGRKSIATLIEGLRAEPFLPDALAAQMADQARIADTRRRIAQDVWLTYIKALTPSERAAYADALQEVLDRRSKRQSSRE